MTFVEWLQASPLSTIFLLYVLISSLRGLLDLWHNDK
jgi:hypothetical protein